MKLFARERIRLFSVCAPFGGAATVVLLFAFGNDLLASCAVNLYGKWFLYPVCVLPILLAYELGYFVNRLLIRAFGGHEFRMMEKRILESLVDACLTPASVHYDPDDLVEEEAWATLKKYWRTK
jgi:hypothetical protein